MHFGGVAERVPVYLQHRLATAARDAYTDTHIFEADAARAIARASQGVPRMVNVLAHKCLLLAFGENVHRVTAAHVQLAVRDTPGIAVRPAWWHRMGRALQLPLRWPWRARAGRVTAERPA